MKPFEVRTASLQNGTALLEASAGTGKTFAITGLVLRLLLEGKVESLPQILVVTFTVAATEELKTRIRDGLQQTLSACHGGPAREDLFRELGQRHGAAGAAILRRALAAADEMSVSTIHGFCKRVLEEAAFESGAPFASDFVEDEIPLLLEAARDAVRKEVVPRDNLCAALAVEYDLLPDELVEDYRVWQRNPDTRLRPAAEPLADALAVLQRELQNARALHNGSPPQKLANLQLKQEGKKAFGEFVPVLATVLKQRLLDADDPCLDLLPKLGRSSLEELCSKKSLGDWTSHPFFVACDAVAAAAETAGRALRHLLLATMHARLQRVREHGTQLRFQDLLTQVAAALRDPERGRALLATIRARWQAGLIDEFQDTDPLQYEIFAECFRDRLLLLVGDPKQAIYAFRGADVHAYLDARAGSKRQNTLAENWRSHPALVQAVGHLFAGPLAFALPEITMPEVTAARPAAQLAIHGETLAPLQLRYLGQRTNTAGKTGMWIKEDLETRTIADVADECVRLLDGAVRLATGSGERRLCAGDIAVLTRTNSQAVRMQDELRSRGVHSAIGRAGDVFDCDEMAEMQRLLAALANPLRQPLLRAAWTTRLWGMTTADLLAMHGDSDRLQQQLEQAFDLRRLWLKQGFVVMFEKLLVRLGCRERLLQRPDGERRLTNYLQIAELLHRAESERQLAPESLLLWLRHERQHAREIDYQLRELRLESDADAVQILTVHGSKGLQYEVVFAPFLGGGGQDRNQRLLVRSADGRLDYVDRSAATAADIAAAARERIAEDVRLAYVAVTRAKRRCYLHWGSTRGAESSALAFLLHGPGRIGQGAADTPWDAAWSRAVATRAGEWPRDLDALVAASDGTIAWSAVPATAPAPRRLTGQAATTRHAAARPMPRPGKPGWRIASFTSMLAAGQVSAVERDHAEPTAATTATTTPDAATLQGVHAFARGAKPGIALHAILERLDFAAADRAPARDLCAQLLREHGLDAPTAHAAPIDAVAVVHATLQRLCRAPLPTGFRLADLAPRARAVEWQFFVKAGRLRPDDLADVFAATGERDYAERLAQLGDKPMDGFLRGFVDLLCEHDGRYWVFDWKSNWLGAGDDAYAPAALQQDLRQNDYVLQYHLYLLALHRHLRARLPGYDYDRHVGGACYVYLRGVEHAAHGAITDRPPRERIEALDRWLEGSA